MLVALQVDYSRLLFRLHPLYVGRLLQATFQMVHIIMPLKMRLSSLQYETIQTELQLQGTNVSMNSCQKSNTQLQIIQMCL